MAYVTIPKDLTKVKSKVLFGLTKRQLICFGAASLIGVPLFFLLRRTASNSTAAFCMIIVMLPFFLLAMYERHGQPLEVVAGQVIRCMFLRTKERPYQTNNFVFEPNIHDLNDLGWRYLAQHMDMLLPPELLKTIDPVPFGKYALQEEQGHFTEHGYISLSGDEWNHEHPAEPEKKPSIRERLEQG